MNRCTDPGRQRVLAIALPANEHQDEQDDQQDEEDAGEDAAYNHRQ